MFCPKCGKSGQKENTYCRQCGVYLPDFTKEGKRRISPEEHIKSNIVLSIMTVVASLTLAIMLISFFFGKENTSPLIYATVGFLFAMSAWQAQTLWRTFQLKKHFRERKGDAADREFQQPANRFQTVPTKKLLDKANFAGAVPTNVVENTTKNLAEKVARKSTQSKH